MVFSKLEIDVDLDALLEVTLPPGPVEEKEDTYKAFVQAGRASVLANE